MSKVPDPPCRTSCPTGYELIDCNCIREEQPCPDGFEKDVYGNCVKSPCRNTCPTGYVVRQEDCGCRELPPCFNSLIDLESNVGFDTNKIINSLDSFLNNFGIETDLIAFLKESKLFDPSKLSETIQSYIKTSDYLGATGDAVGIIVSVGTYLEEPKTENLLRIAFEGASLALPPGSSLGISLIELFENRDGKTIIDLLLIEASKVIEKQIGCNLGTGIRGLIDL